MTTAALYAHPAKQQRSQRSLAVILDAAEAVLAREGWDAFTMNAVAAESGVSIGGIYRRFPNKEHLLRALKDKVLTRADVRQREIAQHRAPNLVSAVEYYVNRRVEALRGYAPILRRILNAQPQDPVMEERGRQSVELAHKTFRSAITPHRDEVKHPDPDLAIDIAFYTLNGAVLRKMMSKPSDASLEHVDWDVLQREMSVVLLSYLRKS